MMMVGGLCSYGSDRTMIAVRRLGHVRSLVRLRAIPCLNCAIGEPPSDPGIAHPVDVRCASPLL